MFRAYSQNALIFVLFGGTMLQGQGQTEPSPLAEADQAFERGDFATALKSYQWYRSDAKLRASAHIQSGHCLLKLGNPSSALREWRSVWESWPDAPEAATALALEIHNTKNAVGRKKLEDMLLAKYAESGAAKALQAARAMASTATAKLTPASEAEQLLAAGKREEAAELLISTARQATGEERDRLLAQLAALYESTGDWRKAAGAWRKIADEGNAEYREASTFDWIRTTAAIGRNAELVEDMWLKFLRDYPASTQGHLAVTRLAEMMVLQERADEAAVLLNGWLNSSEGKSAGANFVSMRLAELRQQQETDKGGALTALAKERMEAAAKLPAEVGSLCDLARTGKRTGKILNRIRDIRSGLAGSVADSVLILQLDRAQALALHGQRGSRRALDLLDDTWNRNSELLASKDAAVHLAATGLAGDAIGIALQAGNHSRKSPVRACLGGADCRSGVSAGTGRGGSSQGCCAPAGPGRCEKRGH